MHYTSIHILKLRILPRYGPINRPKKQTNKQPLSYGEPGWSQIHLNVNKHCILPPADFEQHLLFFLSQIKAMQLVTIILAIWGSNIFVWKHPQYHFQTKWQFVCAPWKEKQKKANSLEIKKTNKESFNQTAFQLKTLHTIIFFGWKFT